MLGQRSVRVLLRRHAVESDRTRRGVIRRGDERPAPWIQRVPRMDNRAGADVQMDPPVLVEREHEAGRLGYNRLAIGPARSRREDPGRNGEPAAEVYPAADGDAHVRARGN